MAYALYVHVISMKTYEVQLKKLKNESETGL
jgi:hypothetical protein